RPWVGRRTWPLTGATDNCIEVGRRQRFFRRKSPSSPQQVQLDETDLAQHDLVTFRKVQSSIVTARSLIGRRKDFYHRDYVLSLAISDRHVKLLDFLRHRQSDFYWLDRSYSRCASYCGFDLRKRVRDEQIRMDLA